MTDQQGVIERVRLRQALGRFLVDARFHVSVGGDPHAVQQMLDQAKLVYTDSAGPLSPCPAAPDDKWAPVEQYQPRGEDHLLLCNGADMQFQCVGYWNRMTKAYCVNGEMVDGLDVTHSQPLPALPKKEVNKKC